MKHATNFLTHTVVGAVGGIVGIVFGIGLVAVCAKMDVASFNECVVGEYFKEAFKEET